MELVRGVPTTKYCDEQRLTTAARLGLFTQVCHAIQHAHQKGIIHRDIKPSNILVTLHDGVPIPKVIDFGIAKATHGRLTDNTLFTAFEQFIGTPAYMSPEQAEMSSLDIDTRSDIYSLGVLLYELLTGRTPFEGKELMQAGLDEMRRQIREVEPQRPSTRLGTLEKAMLTTTAQHRHTDAQKLLSLVGGDLDWIVMRCLEKDRTRRYDTANSLADDIGRHLGNEPVTARPPSTAYRLGKAIRRNKIAFGAGAAVAASLAVGLAVSSTLYLKEKAAHEFAVQAALDLDRSRAKTPDNEIQRQLYESKAKINAYALPLLKETFKGLGTGSLSESSLTQLLQTLDQTADRLNRDSALWPYAKDVLLDALGDAFMELGEFGRAEQIFRQLLVLRCKTPANYAGPMRPDAATTLGKLIEALKRQGKSAEAEAELKKFKSAQSEFIRSESGGFYLRHLGIELHNQGKYHEAQITLEHAKEVLKNVTRGRRIGLSANGEWVVKEVPEARKWGGTYVTELDALILYERFLVGDFLGAEAMANACLQPAKEERWWFIIDQQWMDGHWISGDGPDWEWSISNANLVLGRIALR